MEDGSLGNGENALQKLGEPVVERAKQAASLSRTLERRPELLNSFIQVYAQAEINGENKLKLTPELLEHYNTLVGGGGYADDRSRERISRIIDNTYLKIDMSDAGLTLDMVAKFYDQLNLNEPFIDGNKRAAILALTHLLRAHNIKGPDFTNVNHNTLRELYEKYPTDHGKAMRSFFKDYNIVSNNSSGANTLER